MSSKLEEIYRIHHSTECDECGESIPDDEPNMVNVFHDESCSLHPNNVK